jgi:hypothetical protein
MLKSNFIQIPEKVEAKISEEEMKISKEEQQKNDDSLNEEDSGIDYIESDIKGHLVVMQIEC